MATEISATDALPLPVDPVRTAVALSYNEPGAIADRVLPQLPQLAQEEFLYKRYRRADSLELPNADLGRTGEPAEVEFTGTQVNDRTEHHGLMDPVPASDRDSAASGGWGDPVNVASANLAHLLTLLRERRTAQLVFGASTYASDYKIDLATDASGANQFDESAGDVIGVMENARIKMAFAPNVAVFGQEAWSMFRRHPKVLKAVNTVSGADSGLATRQAVAELLELDEVLVGTVRYATNKPGQSLKTGRVWGKSVALIYRGGLNMGGMDMADGGSGMAAGPQLMGTSEMPTFGFTAVYVPMAVSAIFNPKRGVKGATEVICRDSSKEVAAGGQSGFGYLIQNATP